MREHFKNFKKIVIKVGTTTLTHSNGSLNLKTIEKLSWVLTNLRNQGKDVVLVTSGAITVGVARLGLSQRPEDTVGKQVASAVGQAALIQIYENFFMQYSQKAAQILLTKDVINDDKRKENAKNTFLKLFLMGVIPIVNQNDTVSTDELEFSDNDMLSAYVAQLIESDMLIILSDIKGLYETDPKKDKASKLISYIDDISDEIIDLAGGSGSLAGTGGMKAKIFAAELAMKVGIDTIITSGENPEVIFKILDGEDIGTYFKAKRG